MLRWARPAVPTHNALSLDAAPNPAPSTDARRPDARRARPVTAGRRAGARARRGAGARRRSAVPRSAEVPMQKKAARPAPCAPREVDEDVRHTRTQGGGRSSPRAKISVSCAPQTTPNHDQERDPRRDAGPDANRERARNTARARVDHTDKDLVLRGRARCARRTARRPPLECTKTSVSPTRARNVCSSRSRHTAAAAQQPPRSASTRCSTVPPSML